MALHGSVQKSLSLKFKSYNEKPCAELFKSVAWNWEDKSHWNDKAHMKFEYIDDYYEEIEYLKYFGTESLISNLGGFIGIFLGYSLMQLPELLGRDKIKICTFKIRLNNFLQTGEAFFLSPRCLSGVWPQISVAKLKDTCRVAQTDT